MFRNMFFHHHHMRARMRGDCFGGEGSGERGERFRGPKFFDAGALRYIVLQLIAEKPRHGYEIIKEIEQKIGGGYSPSPGVIYPLLSMLQDQGYVSVAADGNKNLHTITPEGKAFLDENRSFVDAIQERMSAKGRGGNHDIRHTIQEMLMLMQTLRRRGLSEEQKAKVHQILKQALEEIAKV
jgi:DNA-binding PadR family transcriptional regulator